VACFYVRTRESQDAYHRAIFLSELTMKALMPGISVKFHIETTRIGQITYTSSKKLKIILDDENIKYLEDGLDLVVDFISLPDSDTQSTKFSSSPSASTHVSSLGTHTTISSPFAAASWLVGETPQTQGLTEDDILNEFVKFWSPGVQAAEGELFAGEANAIESHAFVERDVPFQYERSGRESIRLGNEAWLRAFGCGWTEATEGSREREKQNPFGFDPVADDGR
jgi:hypothetical protein